MGEDQRSGLVLIQILSVGSYENRRASLRLGRTDNLFMHWGGATPMSTLSRTCRLGLWVAGDSSLRLRDEERRGLDPRASVGAIRIEGSRDGLDVQVSQDWRGVRSSGSDLTVSESTASEPKTDGQGLQALQAHPKAEREGEGRRARDRNPR